MKPEENQLLYSWGSPWSFCKPHNRSPHVHRLSLLQTILTLHSQVLDQMLQTAFGDSSLFLHTFHFWRLSPNLLFKKKPQHPKWTSLHTPQLKRILGYLSPSSSALQRVTVTLNGITMLTKHQPGVGSSRSCRTSEGLQIPRQSLARGPPTAGNKDELFV